MPTTKKTKKRITRKRSVKKIRLLAKKFSPYVKPGIITGGIVLGVGILLVLFLTFYKPHVVKPAPSFSAEYTAAFTKKQWDGLWNLYAPDYQRAIESSVGKKAYLSFLQKKFFHIRVTHISLGACKTGQTVFPYGVERNYINTCVATLTLSLFSPSATVAAQLPILTSSSLVLTKIGKQTFIVGGGPTDLQAPVLFPDAISRGNSTVPILMYHRIAPMPDRADFQTEYGYLIDVGLTITPSNFAAQMDQLQTLGYHTITPNDLFNHLYYNLPLPPKPVLLTFDDGRLSDFTNGLPILLSHHFTATFMIPPFLLGKMFGFHNHNKYMSLTDLTTLTQNGMFVENHSLKHDKPLWDIPPQELQKQLAAANADIFAYTHYPAQFIAYPGRWAYPHWQQTGPAEQHTMQVLSRMGFAFSFLDLGQNETMENTLYPYQVTRIRPENLPAITFLF